jgi:NAD(P)-dependent dehydrogenase (short-subunit alcohol dehydrogenase family)
VLSARNEEALNKLAADLGDSRVVVADLSLSGEAERLAEQAGPIDVLVSNAGIPASGRLITFTVDELDRALAVNVRAGIVLARLLLPGMLERRSGHMVFLSSIAGRIAGPGFGVYSATKFAVRGFALALRAELWGTGVGVSVIYPTFVKESGMWAETGLKPNPIAGEVTPGAGGRSGVLGRPPEPRRGERDAAAAPRDHQVPGRRARPLWNDREGYGSFGCRGRSRRAPAQQTVELRVAMSRVENVSVSSPAPSR